MFDLLNSGIYLFLNGLFQFCLSIESNSVNFMNLGFDLKLSLCVVKGVVDYDFTF